MNFKHLDLNADVIIIATGPLQSDHAGLLETAVFEVWLILFPTWQQEIRLKAHRLVDAPLH